MRVMAHESQADALDNFVESRKPLPPLPSPPPPSPPPPSPPVSGRRLQGARHPSSHLSLQWRAAQAPGRATDVLPRRKRHRRLQDAACVEVTFEYKIEVAPTELADRLTALAGRAAADGESTLAMLETAAAADGSGAACAPSVDISFSLATLALVWDKDIGGIEERFNINVTNKAPSPPSVPPAMPPSCPPPAAPPVTLEAVTNLTNAFLESVRNGSELTEEAATSVVESLSVMMEVTAGGGSGKEVAAALVQGVELVGEALLGAKEVGAPPTEVVSAALQISVAKRDPELLDATPFTVPAIPGGKASVAQVVMPKGVIDGAIALGELSTGEAVGTTLWSSTTDNVHGVDMGVARAGSPTLAFSLSVNGTELRIRDLAKPIQLKLDVYEALDPASTCVGPPTGQVSTQ